MAFNYKAGCKSCEQIELESPERFQNSKLYKMIEAVNLKTLPLSEVARIYTNISYLAIRNHAKKHQHPSIRRVVQAQLDRVEAKEPPRPGENVQANRDSLRQGFLDLAAEKMQLGQMDVTPATLVKIFDQLDKMEMKQKDQALKLQEMVWAFASADKMKGVIDGTIVASKPELQ